MNTLDTVDRRALAWLRFVDAATGAPIETSVTAIAPGARLIRKGGGDIVVMAAEGLAGNDAFDAPPALPAVGSVPLVIDVTPVDGVFAPRRVTLSLPRDPNPANATASGSLFRPALAALFPGPGYTRAGQLAGIRVTIRRSSDNARVEGALVRLRIGAVLVARGLTNAGGEALLMADGLKLATVGPGPTVLHDVAGEVDAVVDPALARFATDTTLVAARNAEARRTSGHTDPDDLEDRLGAAATAPVAVRVRAGATSAVSLVWPPP